VYKITKKREKMKWKLMILLCLPLLYLHVRANDTIPLGSWAIEKVMIEKNTDGRTENREYNSKTDDEDNNSRTDDSSGNRNNHSNTENRASNTAKSVQSYIRCSHILEVRDSETMVLHYPDGTEEIAKYTFDGHLLLVDVAVAMLTYQCSIGKENLTLRITHNYVNNLPTGRTERIEEKWTIDLIINKKSDQQ